MLALSLSSVKCLRWCGTEVWRGRKQDVTRSVPYLIAFIYKDCCPHNLTFAIDMALDFVLEHQLFSEIWIFSFVQSSVVLDNWRDVGGDRREWISLKLKTL
ncbi:hypothetical protein AVEN_114957-1 [Araneus ventricosus]|uniref:Uncharacterized protein n=1 Tax=Araneus ventricosus TaxID=182803 RepID=A0A4Y2D807_ARAVE|nr:hypothetical protein AVEN_114957-1 [Araneus ventricosus]